MRTGVVVSIVAHLALLAWALYSVAATRTLEPVEEVPINVDLVSIADVPNIRQGDKNAKTEATKGEKDKTKQTANPTKAKNERVAVVAPTKKEEVKAKDPEKKEEVKVEEPKKEEPKKEEPKKEEPKKEEPKLEPKKEEVKKEEPKTETATVPEKKKEEPKKEEPKKVAKDEPKKEKKATKDKKEFDPDKIAALLDKQPDAAATAETTKATAKPKEKPKLQIGAENGSGDALTISEKQALIAALRQQISRCWSPPGGQSGAELITVRLAIELEQDGSLKGMPRTLNREASPLFLIAEESAVRAVYDCQPYNLPNEHYTAWRSVNFKFDPSEMMDGGF